MFERVASSALCLCKCQGSVGPFFLQFGHCLCLGGVEVDIGDPIGMHFGGGDEPIPSSLHMFTEDI